MFMRRRFQKDNQGVALISVMICVMLCFLLSATIMRMSMLSYLQKGISKQSSSTFYENESFMDDIKMGLQQKVAVAYAECATSTTGRDAFVDTFAAKVYAAGGLASTTGATDAQKKAALEAALKTFIQTGAEADVKVVSLSIDTTSGDFFVTEGDGEIVIKNVRIGYTDQTTGGYISNIKTDIRIRTPYYTVKSTPISNSRYSMIAGGGTSAFSADGQDTVLHVSGSYYSGYENPNMSTNSGYGGTAARPVATAMKVGKGSLLYFTESAEEKATRITKNKETNSVVFNGDLYIEPGARLVFLGGTVVVRGTIYIESGYVTVKESRAPDWEYKDHTDWKEGQLVVSNETTLVCRDIVFKSGNTISGKVSDGNYSGTHTIEHLPYPKKPQYNKSQGDKPDTDYDGQGKFFICTTARNSIVVGDGTTDLRGHVVEASYSNGTVTQSGKIKLTDTGRYTGDSSVPSTDPVKNVKKSDGNYYDVEYCGIVDIEWFLKGMSQSGYTAPTANAIKVADSIEEKASSSNETDTLLNSNGDKFYWKNGTGTTNDSNGGGEEQGNQEIGAMTIRVCIGNHDSMLSTSNVANYFYLTTHAISFNDMNWNQDVKMVMLSPQKVTMKPKDGGIVRMIPMKQGLTDAQYKTFIDKVGLHLTKSDGDTVTYNQYNIVNNYFVGGIKSLYASVDSDGHTSQSTSIEVTTVDMDKNRSLDVVSFENWEKEPAVPDTTS